MAPRIGPPTRFEALAQQVQGERRFYDRKASKHIRFDDGDGVYLHRGFDPVGLTAKSRAQNAVEIAEKRGKAARHIFDTIAADLGPEAAESVFRKVKGDGFDLAPRHGSAAYSDQGVTLKEFDRIAQEVETIRQGMSGAILNGVTQSTEQPGAFNAALGQAINSSYRMNRVGSSPATAGADTEGAISPLMLREMGKATYSFNDVVVSSPDFDDTGFPQGRGKGWSAFAGDVVTQKLLVQAHVRDKDIAPLSTVLNRDLFDAFQGIAEEQAQQSGAGFTFTPVHDPEGLSIRCTPDVQNPGFYIFSATLKQPLAGIDAVDQANRYDRLDPQRSHLRLDIHGIINCNNPDNPVEVGASSIAYAGHLAEEESPDRR